MFPGYDSSTSNLPPEGRFAYGELRTILEKAIEKAIDEWFTYKDARDVPGIANAYPFVDPFPTSMRYAPEAYFGRILAETVIGGVPPREFPWKYNRFSAVWPLYPAVFAEDVDSADASDAIDNAYVLSIDATFLDREFNIVVLEANDIESNVEAYIGIPENDDGTEMLWRRGVLGDYIIDPQIAEAMNNYFEAGLADLTRSLKL